MLTNLADGDVNPRAIRWHLLGAGLLLAFLLVWDLGGRELWTDEGFSLVARAELGHAMWGDASHPPGYFLLLHFWLQQNQSDGWLRAFSIPWALLVWLLGWLIARRLGLWREGLVAAWLMALSPLVLTYFRLGRYYAMAAALTLLCVYLALGLVQKPGLWRALLLALALVATGYTDYTALLIVSALVALYCLAALLKREWRAAAWLATAGVTAAVALVPLLSWVAHQARQVAAIPPDPMARTAWGVVLKLALPVFSLATGECIDPWRWPLVVPAVVVTTLLLVVGLVSLLRRGGSTAVTALVWPVTIVLATVALSTLAANVPANRVTSFAMFTIPLAYLLVGRGVVTLPDRWARILALVIIGGVYVYGAHNYFLRQQLLNPGFAPPWRQVAAIIQAHEQPGDLIVSAEDAFDRYYAGHAQVGHEAELQQLIVGQRPFDRRIWLIARDRGSQQLAALGQQLRDRLRAQGAVERVFDIDPRTAKEQQMLSLVLRRPAWDAYVKVYLLQRGS